MLHFGLGTLQGPLQVTVLWPSGTEQILEIPDGQQQVHVLEGVGLVAGN
ncbi:MAG: ASPIC/UnbV domain-containing protein [Planctomycetaceae bacterium]